MEEDTEVVEVAKPIRLRGKALLDRLFVMAAMSPKRLMANRVGRHHKARSLRAQARIAKRKAAR